MHHHISRRGLFRGVLGATEQPNEEQIRTVRRRLRRERICF